jgi:hypothetical protein
MVPPGMSLLAMLQHPAMSSALAPALFVGDPMAIGATRINPASTDEGYRALLKASFYADVPEPEFIDMVSHLHCDEPNGGALAPSSVTAGRFGTVPRHYIRCTQDRAIPLAGQDHMIAMVDAAIGGRTIIHEHRRFRRSREDAAATASSLLRANDRLDRRWRGRLAGGAHQGLSGTSGGRRGDEPGGLALSHRAQHEPRFPAREGSKQCRSDHRGR